MGYLQTGCLVEMSDPSALMGLFAAQGWTIKTAVCMAVFSLFTGPVLPPASLVKGNRKYPLDRSGISASHGHWNHSLFPD